MLEKWKLYQATEVLTGKDGNGNRLISLFAKDYKTIMQNDICPSCNDFEIKYQNFINKLENMSKVEIKNSGFSLKPMYENITLHGSQVYFNNSNLTDELAIQLLEKHPKGEGLFDLLPENWKDLKKTAPIVPATPVVPATVINLFTKDFSVDDAKDLFKSAGIDSRATTVTGLQNSLSKATDEQKTALQNLVTALLAPIVPATPVVPALEATIPVVDETLVTGEIKESNDPKPTA